VIQTHPREGRQQAPAREPVGHPHRRAVAAVQRGTERVRRGAHERQVAVGDVHEHRGETRTQLAGQPDVRLLHVPDRGREERGYQGFPVAEHPRPSAGPQQVLVALLGLLPPERPPRRQPGDFADVDRADLHDPLLDVQLQGGVRREAREPLAVRRRGRGVDLEVPERPPAGDRLADQPLPVVGALFKIVHDADRRSTGSSERSAARSMSHVKLPAPRTVG